jgi:hypothetical protein
MPELKELSEILVMDEVEALLKSILGEKRQLAAHFRKDEWVKAVRDEGQLLQEMNWFAVPPIAKETNREV